MLFKEKVRSAVPDGLENAGNATAPALDHSSVVQQIVSRNLDAENLVGLLQGF